MNWQPTEVLLDLYHWESLRSHECKYDLISPVRCVAYQPFPVVDCRTRALGIKHEFIYAK